MTRPKVDPDKRQRIAQACVSCKRRKQKCNGLRPCNTCSKRSSSCSYGESENGSDEQPSPKRRMAELATNSIAAGPPHLNSQPPQKQQRRTISQKAPASNGVPKPADRLQDLSGDNTRSEYVSLFPMAEQENRKEGLTPVDATSQLLSRGTTVSAHDEEAVVYNYTRMLQDPTGRLLYIGDSATLSFLQLIRMIVDNVAGPSPFTMDPSRHRIVENAIALPANIRHTHLLPDRQTANVLVEAFFSNTNGLIEVFHRKSFLNTLEVCYTDPLNVDPSWLCLLYLIFAIGLVMAIPTPGTREDAIIQKLRGEDVDRAEVFYSDAKHLCDPSTGFEDAGFWSIQALTLMSVYMLAVSKRNAAYAYYGMAVRSAFAMGLHREETMCIFSGAEQRVRRNLWRSLYVLDRFLSASLGRPTAIRESDCSGDTLTTGEKPPFPQAPFPTAANAGFTDALSLEASVRSCHVIGVILEQVYSKRKISTKLAQEIADKCKGFPKALDPSLHWRQANSANPAQGIAILHVNLFYCHSIVLLTRPFFLFLMNKIHQERRETGQKRRRHGSRMEKFAEACVIASCHSIALVQSALEGRYLPHRNPFVLYFLFASALVVLSNEFSALYQNPTARSCIANAINIMQYCSQHDPQASRLLFILTTFRDVAVRQNASSSSSGLNSDIPPQLSLHQLSTSLDNSSNDPIRDLFLDSTIAQGSSATSAPVPGPDSIPKKQNSNPAFSLAHLLTTPNLDSSSSTVNGISSSADTRDRHIHSPHSIRNNSFDAFFDLAHVSSQNGGSSVDGTEMGEEIDFEMLWQWPSSNQTELMLGGSGLTVTPGGSNGVVGDPQGGMVGSMDAQGLSNGSVLLFTMPGASFEGN